MNFTPHPLPKKYTLALSFHPFVEPPYFRPSNLFRQQTKANESMATGWKKQRGKINTAIMSADNGHQGVIWIDQKEKVTKRQFKEFLCLPDMDLLSPD